MKDLQLIHKKYQGPAIYQITIKGYLDKLWTDRLAGLVITHTTVQDSEISILTGKIEDQSELNGILNTLFQQHFAVISMYKLKDI